MKCVTVWLRACFRRRGHHAPRTTGRLPVRAFTAPCMTEPTIAKAPRLTARQWLVCAIVAMGFAFDTYELLMLPLVVRPALLELGGIRPGSPEFSLWFGLLFYVPAVAGGLFGLLGGYLTDRLGRRRVLAWSIWLYALSAFAAGFATSLPMLLALRCLTFIGVCVEFVAAVAWLAEFFPDGRQREAVLGATQAFSSLGGLLVALASGLVTAWAAGRPGPLLFGLHLPAVSLPAIRLPSGLGILGTIADPHADWRYVFMSGLVAAIPLLLVRPFLPESPPWLAKRRTGRLRRPSLAALFAPELRRTTWLTTLMFTCSVAAAFGAIHQMPQIVPGLPEVRAEVAAAQAARLSPDKLTQLRARWESEGRTEAAMRQALEAEKRRIAGPIEQAAAARAAKTQEIGGLCGRIALAGLALTIVGRGRLLRVFLFPGFLVMPLTFAWAGVTSVTSLEYGMFLAGFLTIAQFSFWGNYLPRVYPLDVRGTGESFAANVGGRLIGTCFAAVTQWIAWWLPLDLPYAAKVAWTAGGVALASYLVAFTASFWLPEPGTDGVSE